MTPTDALVLSVFPGIDSRKSKLFRSTNTALNHVMVIGAENPDVLFGAVANSGRSPIPGCPVVKVNNSVLATDHALLGHLGMAQKEALGGMTPGRVLVDPTGTASIGISLMELFKAPAVGLGAAGIGTILTTPIVTVKPGEHGPADRAGPFGIGGLAMMLEGILLGESATLAGLRAKSLIEPPRLVLGTAVIACALGIVNAPSPLLFQSGVVSSDEAIPPVRRHLRPPHGEATSALTDWRTFDVSSNHDEDLH